MATWLQFKLIEKPCYDEAGNVLASIAGLRNRKGIDGFGGSGRIYPDLRGVKVLERHLLGATLLLLVDAPAADVSTLTAATSKPVTYWASPKTELTVSEGLNPKVLTDEEARALKLSVFGIKAESGVTK